MVVESLPGDARPSRDALHAGTIPLLDKDLRRGLNQAGPRIEVIGFEKLFHGTPG
jgi:hypothetical protein